MNAALEKIGWHETRVFAMNGTVYPFTFQLVLRIATSRLFLVCLFTYIAALAIAQSEIYRVDVPLLLRLVYMAINGALTLALWLTLLVLSACIVARILKPYPIPTLALHLLTMSIMVLANRFVFERFFGPPFAPDMSTAIIEIAEYSALLLVFEYFVVLFLMPRFDWVAELMAEPAEATLEPVAAQSITAAGRDIAVDQIRYLKSVEHYVEIVDHERTTLVRAALRDLVDQLAGHDGIQPHRSYWVTYEAVDRICRDKSNMILRLKDGSSIPVSRGRRSAVQAWWNER